MGAFRILISVAIALCLLPVASVVFSALTAGSAGCQLDEGNVHACVLGGHDYGDTLYVMFVSGWFALVTLPILLVMVPVWIVCEILHWARRPDRSAPNP